MRKDFLKVLNSEAKMNILRELAKGQKTPTDLSKKLGKVKSTVVEHLEELVDLGLVIKSEEAGRKWVFYSLSREGYRLLEGRPKIYEFLFPSSLISIFLGFVIWFSQRQTLQKAYPLAKSSEALIYNQTSFASVVAYLLILLGLFGLTLYFIKVRRL
jgi:DNA-binding transcriptional ArsR family regulator